MARAALTPRKRPLQRRAVATVAAILEAAARILEEGGFEGFNTNAIAERAGVGVGSLYQYFPGKDAITAALIRLEASKLLAALDEAVTRSESASLAYGIGALADVAVAHQLARPKLARLLDVEEARLPLAAETRATMLAIRDRVETFLKDHAGELRLAAPAIAAADLLFIAKGLVDGTAQVSEPDKEDLRRRVVSALVGYLREEARSISD